MKTNTKTIRVAYMDLRRIRRPVVGIKQAHKRVWAQRGPAAEQTCIGCSGPALDWAYQHSDPHPLFARSPYGGLPWPYSLDPSQYAPMCRPCHRRYDYRMKAIPA
jgi:hypothetical protein